MGDKAFACNAKICVDMRESLKSLLNSTIIFQYYLPNEKLRIDKTIHTSNTDHCYKVANTNNLTAIIYNGITDYSYNENKIDLSNLSSLHIRALKSKIRYTEDADPETKLKYGFFGEILLYLILSIKYGTNTLISRGYFYNPLESSETKGYDTYQLIQKESGKVELWFGEVKFYHDYHSALKKIYKNIPKTLSDEYLSQNIIAMSDRGEFNIHGTAIESIVTSWENNPTINIAEELLKWKISFVYPILLIFDDKNKEYNIIIKEVIDHINSTYKNTSYSLSIPTALFFILLPVSKTNDIKKEVIQWIESNHPLI